MNNEASKVRSIRMTDQQYELLSRNAKDNHLSIGNYLEKIADDMRYVKRYFGKEH